MEGIVKAVCISPQKGTPKTDVTSCPLVAGHGLQGDAHAGDWHRQLSLLSFDKVREFQARGAFVAAGAFGENLLVAGLDLAALPVGTLLRCNGAQLQVTQIGKECHAPCGIYRQVGDCIMPREGVFARVLTGGTVSVGDVLYVL